MSWPLEIDGREYKPIPASWLEHPQADDYHEGQTPRIYAVSAAIEYGGKKLQIRYAHPTEPYVLRASTGAYEIESGTVPAGLHQSGSRWPRSMRPNAEPSDVIRDAEREHLREVWAHRVEAIPAPAEGADRQLVTDGGHSLTSDDDRPLRDALRYAGGQECPSCGRTVGIADRYCRWCGTALRADDTKETR